LKAKVEIRTVGSEPGREAGLLRIYGRRPILMALRAGKVRQLWMASGVRGEIIQDIVRAASEQGIEVMPLDTGRLPKDDRLVHQGVMAKVSLPEVRRDFEAFVDEVTSKDESVLLLVLDGVEDPQNFGAVLRVAECAGVQGIIVSRRHRSPLTAAVAKSSAGALFSIDIVEVTNLNQAARSLKENGIWIVAATGEGEVLYSDFDWKRSVALIMGAEGRGVSPLLKQTADARMRIPLMGAVESLNVSTATGIVLFECLRQRQKRKVAES
jgi:23S rRNA (guanosine2251-2'-O)-methyltransferase